MFNEAEVLNYLNGQDDQGLFEQANLAREKEFGNEIFLRGIVEFSNFCRNDCNYCGLRTSNRELERYRLNVDTILAGVDEIAASGLGTLVLQSGDDFKYSGKVIAELIQTIKSKHDIAVTLSLGDRSHEDLSLWREAGADRYLLKMETFDRELFAKSRPGADYDERLARLAHLKEIGFQAGSGVIIGLPGMTNEILAKDIMALTELGMDMLAAGPYIPHPQTPYANEPMGSVLLTYRATALLRLMNPGSLVPATSALAAIEPGAREKALLCGANVMMPSFTPLAVSNQYHIYPGKNAATTDVAVRLKAVENDLAALGLKPSLKRGDSRRQQFV